MPNMTTSAVTSLTFPHAPMRDESIVSISDSAPAPALIWYRVARALRSCLASTYRISGPEWEVTTKGNISALQTRCGCWSILPQVRTTDATAKIREFSISTVADDKFATFQIERSSRFYDKSFSIAERMNKNAKVFAATRKFEKTVGDLEAVGSGANVAWPVLCKQWLANRREAQKRHNIAQLARLRFANDSNSGATEKSIDSPKSAHRTVVRFEYDKIGFAKLECSTAPTIAPALLSFVRKLSDSSATTCESSDSDCEILLEQSADSDWEVLSECSDSSWQIEDQDESWVDLMPDEEPEDEFAEAWRICSSPS